MAKQEAKKAKELKIEVPFNPPVKGQQFSHREDGKLSRYIIDKVDKKTVYLTDSKGGKFTIKR